MGLDMYLNKIVFFPYFLRETKEYTLDVPKVNTEKVRSIECEAIYWRKANAIHRWFVKNVQNGVDDCGRYDVSKEELQNLYELVCEVLKHKNKAEELLPTQEGFFFGNVEYGEDYWDDINYTKEQLELLFEEMKNEEEFAKLDFNNTTVVWYQYTSSW